MAEVDHADRDALNAASCRWAALPPSELRFRQWDDEAVVHVPASGDTHLIGPAPAAVLAALLSCHPEGRTSAALLADVFEPPEAEPEAEPRYAADDSELVHETLRSLEAIGLVRRHT